MFWSRGAAPALRKAIAEAYVASARYLDEAIAFGMARCAFDGGSAPSPDEQALRAAASSRRLDDAYRTYLAEQGPKPVPLADMTSLVIGVTALRLASDAVLDLWQRDDGSAPGDRTAARAEIQRASDRVRSWYVDLASGLEDAHDAVRRPLEHDDRAEDRLVEAVRNDLRDEQGHATRTAVRMIWTGDYLDAARRLQGSLVGPAQVATQDRAGQSADGLPPVACAPSRHGPAHLTDPAFPIALPG